MRTFIITITTFIFFALMPVAFAQPAGSGNSNPPAGLGNPAANQGGQSQNITLINPLKGVDCSAGNGNNCLSAFLLNILQFVVYIGGIIVVLMLVFVGFKFVAAQGVPEKIKEARQMLLWTVVGALILLGAQAIAMGIQATVTAFTGG